MKIASFDIFDTTLLRTCGAAENVFFLISKRLFPDDTERRKIFYEWRLKAEKIKRGELKRDLTIFDIYNDDSITVLCGRPQAEIIEIELAVERMVLRPNPSVVDQIENYRKKGFHIVFISDMYLSSSFLISVLTENEIFKEDDCLFVSNEFNKRKSTGELYKYIRNKLNPDYWIHHGDNMLSDVKMARKVGIQSKHINTDYNKTEKIICISSLGLLCEHECSILAGFTRYQRLSANNSFDVFASIFMVPSFLSYIYYIRNYVNEKKLKRLYFLSRDSYILMKAFEEFKLPVESKFFFISRRSLLMPYFYISSKESFKEAYSSRSLINQRCLNVLESLDVRIDDLKKNGIKLEIDKIQTAEQEIFFLDILFNSPLTPLIRNNAKIKYNQLVAYLRQEGVTDNISSAAVDVGWIGTTRMMLNRILDSINSSRLHFIYYGVEDNVYPFRYGSYSFFTHINGSTMTKCVEQYFSDCPYPTTIGYEIRDGIVVPLFPTGKKVCKSNVFKSNIGRLIDAVNWYDSMDIYNYESLLLWAQNASSSLINCWDNIDYAVLASNEINKHESAITRKMNLFEALKFLLGVRNVVGVEKVSAILTFGYVFTNFYWSYAMFFRRIRKRIERKIGIYK